MKRLFFIPSLVAGWLLVTACLPVNEEPPEWAWLRDGSFTSEEVRYLDGPNDAHPHARAVEKKASLDMEERQLDVTYVTSEGDDIVETYELSGDGWAPFQESTLF